MGSPAAGAFCETRDSKVLLPWVAPPGHVTLGWPSSRHLLWTSMSEIRVPARGGFFSSQLSCWGRWTGPWDGVGTGIGTSTQFLLRPCLAEEPACSR